MLKFTKKSIYTLCSVGLLTGCFGGPTIHASYLPTSYLPTSSTALNEGAHIELPPCIPTLVLLNMITHIVFNTTESSQQTAVAPEDKELDRHVKIEQKAARKYREKNLRVFDKRKHNGR